MLFSLCFQVFAILGYSCSLGKWHKDKIFLDNGLDRYLEWIGMDRNLVHDNQDGPSKPVPFAHIWSISL